jgi:transposase
MAPPLVNADVTSPQHETREAEAIGEAVTRPTMRVVPVTQLAQHAIQAWHRIRARLIKARTALVHEIRGLLSEDGMVLPQGIAKCRTSVVRQLEAEQAKRTPLSTAVFWHLYEAFVALEQRVAYSDETRQALARAPPVRQRAQAIPGIGPLTATAVLAAVPEATHVNNGRPWAARLGLVPREHATGGKPRRLGRSTRGEVSLRTLLVHGARATRRGVDTNRDDRHRWLKALIARRGKNRAAVA